MANGKLGLIKFPSSIVTHTSSIHIVDRIRVFPIISEARDL